MIPSIETIAEDLAAGRISTAQATAWLYRHAEGEASELRDHFAGLALQGQIAGIDGLEFGNKKAMLEIAAACYEMADAMLAARSAR